MAHATDTSATTANTHNDTNRTVPELQHTLSAFEVVDKSDIDDHANTNSNDMNVSKLASIAPAIWNSFPREYAETIMKKINERATQTTHAHDDSHNDSNHEHDNGDEQQAPQQSDHEEQNGVVDDGDVGNGGSMQHTLRSIAQQIPAALFDAAQLTSRSVTSSIVAQFRNKDNGDDKNGDDVNVEAEEETIHANDADCPHHSTQTADTSNDSNGSTTTLNENENENENDDDEDDYIYEYYHTKMNHDIAWNATPTSNDEMFVISKDLFDIDVDVDVNVDTTSNTTEDTAHTATVTTATVTTTNSNTKKSFSSKNTLKHKLQFGSNHRRNKNAKTRSSSSPIATLKHDDHDHDEKETHPTANSSNKSGFSLWTESLNSMLTHAKYRVYTLLANPALHWDSRSNRHVFSLSHEVWIMGGTRYVFDGDDQQKRVMQSIVLDLYSKVWLTYRSKFEPILRSRYTSDAGWGCMLRTTQMMTAQALLILHFGYDWNLTRLRTRRDIDTYFDDVLSLFNDTGDEQRAPLSIHNMICYGSVLYAKPVGHWYGPMQACIMVSKCIQNCAALSARIHCVVCDDGIIYKSDIVADKHALVFMPLRLGLDALNTKYIASLKQCFHLRECIGIVGGKPQKSLYFIGYQNRNLFYLDPHTVFPTPNAHKPLSRQKCVFHCQDINSLFAEQLDPSMAIAFFIQPQASALEAFWSKAQQLTQQPYSVFSLADKRPNYEQSTLCSCECEDGMNSDANDVDDDEWEKL